MTDSKKRVLLVDDDESIVESVRSALEHRGYQVLVARDGSEGLMRAERDDPDLIILDLVMPRRSGMAVLDRLNQCPQRSRPIIMLTGSPSERFGELAKSRGANCFMSKPFEINSLLNEVETLLDA